MSTSAEVPPGIKPGTKNQIKLKQKMIPGKIVRKEIFDAKGRLGVFTLKPSDGSPIPEFQAGQYTSLGMEVAEGFFVTRAYSIASPPSQRDSFEFFIALVADGALTPHMFKSAVGSTWFFYKPVGHFTLQKTERRNYFFISTGTGLAPFRSMVRQFYEEGRLTDHKIVMANGVSYLSELGYRVEMEDYARKHPHRFFYLPTVSRPAPNHPHEVNTGRINDVIRVSLGHPHTEHTETWPRYAHGFDPKVLQEMCPPKETAVFLCGNPSMIDDLKEPLAQCGYDEIHVEEYW